MRLLLCFALLFIAVPPACAQHVTALVGGTVVSPHRDAPLEDAVVLIEGNDIAAVGPADEVSVPGDALVIDAAGQWIIPGLVDGHVHFFQSGGLYTRPDIIDLRFHRPYAEELALIEERLPQTFRRYLRSGITSVVDVGGPMWNLEVRAMADTMVAPRVVTAGPLISSVQPPELTTDDPPILKVETPEEARRLVREQVAAGVDLVKIWYIVRPDETPAAFRPVVDATIDEAHAAGLRVAVHATQQETARAAVEAGADILVHSVVDEPVDEAFVRLLAENDVLYTPTAMVGERYGDVFAQQVDLTEAEHAWADPQVVASLLDPRELPPDSLPARLRRQMKRGEAAAPRETVLENMRRLVEGDVELVAGTDAGNIGTPHGPSLYYELQLMQRAGLTPTQVLTAATLHGARLMGRADDLGTVEPGKLADLVVLGSDPLVDIGHTSDVMRVIKGGRVFTPDELIIDTPGDIVQRQVNAYNARDLDAFVATYAPDVEIYRHPGNMTARGHDDLRERYGKLFERAPELHAQIVDRIVLGNTVIDRERVTGMSGRSVVEAIAIYRVEDGLIQRVDFISKN